MRVLDELGIRLLFPKDNDPRFAPWVAMARGLHREPELSVLALVPVEPNVGVASAALQLGVALYHLSARPVTLIDCNTAAPGFRALASIERSPQDLDVEVCQGISVVTRRTSTSGIDFGWCKEVIASRTSLGHFVLCDMTGLAETGALGRLYPQLHAVVTVVQSGATPEWRLTALHRQFPKHLDRGVLFVEK